MYNILIIEDNPMDLKLMEASLRKNHANVLTASDWHSADDILQKFRVDLILLDWELPRISGLNIMKTIRGSDRTNKIKVIFVTGKNEAKFVQQAIQAGASDYVVKPVDPLILSGKIEQLTKSSVEEFKLISLPSPIPSQLKIDVKILRMSEVHVEVESSVALPAGLSFQITSSELQAQGLPELSVRVVSTVARGELFLCSCSLLAMKENELSKLRVYLRLSQVGAA